jgi:heat shock protein HslJ
VRLALGSLALVTLLAAGCGGDEESADASSVEGVPWTLVSGVDVPQGAQAPTATFVEGTVSGSTGCNRYTAPYTLDGDSLELGPIASTLMACPPPADAVERDYRSAVERVAVWEVTDDELVLHDAEHEELLRFGAKATAGG